MPVGPYFADFLCRELNVIVEIDGFSYDVQQSYDARRTKALEDHGYRVIRFTNRDVMENIEGVVQQIETLISDMPTLTPSHEREGNC